MKKYPFLFEKDSTRKNEYWYRYEDWIFPTEKNHIVQNEFRHWPCLVALGTTKSPGRFEENYKCTTCGEELPILLKLEKLNKIKYT